MKEQNIDSIKIAQISLLSLSLSFFRIGVTTFGGMWANAHKIEGILVHQNRWISLQELQSMMVAAALIPAPQFMSFGALIGFKLKGWIGSFIAVFSLILPGALVVLIGVLIISPSLLSGPLEPVRRFVGIAVIGLLLGNAYLQLNSPNITGIERIIGISLTLLVAISSIIGVPILISSICGFILGAFFIRNKASESDS
ncbi:chromate transporter [Bacillus sp. Marseille-P3661]|uniref:chromate transporter n=1 Tax=Bacillus sp. Marseille-P3661 TaxID=1936234 RepID=UPI0015E1AFA7|nr:chromate transporter [Bacillus sp. Marseille-P3661]